MPQQILTELGPDRLSALAAVIDDYDVIADSPWHQLFAWLDSVWHRSQFVIWLRDAQQWAQQVQRVTQQLNATAWPWGVCSAKEPDEDGWRRLYEQHVDGVLRYFDRPGRKHRLLLLNYSAPDSTNRLCDFLLSPGALGGAWRRQLCANPPPFCHLKSGGGKKPIAAVD